VSRFVRALLLLTAGVLLLGACAGQPAAVPTPLPAAAVVPTLAPTENVVPTALPSPTPPPTVAASASPVPTVVPTTVPTSLPTADPITGAPALARGAVSERPFVVMIDNHPNAFPQSGLAEAAVVFEALAEFGLTRFMAVYAPGITPESEQVGPVRSARLYFVQWAMGFGGLYVHAGGSPQGLELAQSTDQLVNVDALFRASSVYFRRNAERAAPHNLYTSTAALTAAAAALDTGDYARSDVGFVFKEDAPASARPPSQQISYFFLYREDDAGWTYEQATNSYLRLRRGKAVSDASGGEPLRFKNVVVLEVKEAPLPGDPKGRIEQVVIGEGRARVFLDGVEREVTWSKPSDVAPLVLLDQNGVEVALNAGPVWIVALPALENLSVQ